MKQIGQRGSVLPYHWENAPTPKKGNLEDARFDIHLVEFSFEDW